MSSEIEEIRQRKMAEMMGDAVADVPDSPLTVSDSDFNQFVNKYPVVVVDCWAPWCGPCRALSPTIDALAKDHKGKAVFGKLNTDENFATAAKYRISSIPTVLYFKNGELVNKTIGALPKQVLDSEVQKIMA
jgi:thioredoxin 1